MMLLCSYDDIKSGLVGVVVTSAHFLSPLRSFHSLILLKTASNRQSPLGQSVTCSNESQVSQSVSINVMLNLLWLKIRFHFW